MTAQGKEVLCECNHSKHSHVNGTDECTEKIALFEERKPHPIPKYPGEKTFAHDLSQPMASPDTQCKCTAFTPKKPKVGDTCFNPMNGKWENVYNVSEGVVDISPDRNVTPIPLEHFEPHPNGDPHAWILIGLDHT